MNVPSVKSDNSLNPLTNAIRLATTNSYRILSVYGSSSSAAVIILCDDFM